MNKINIISEKDINMVDNHDFEIIDMPYQEISNKINDNDELNKNNSEYTSEELKIHESFTDEFLQKYRKRDYNDRKKVIQEGFQFEDDEKLA